MKPLAHERPHANDTHNSRSDRIDAVLICSDDGLLIELGPLLGDRYRTHTVDAPTDIAGRVPVPLWIGIIDVDSLPEARAALARLEQQYPHCPLILVASRPEEWAAAVTRGVALAALGRHEVAGVRLAEALAVAQSRLQQADSSTPSAAAPPHGGSETGARAPALLVGAALTALLLAAGLLAWWHHAHRAAATLAAHQPLAAHAAPGAGSAASAEQSTPPLPGPQSELELLSAARVAFHDEKLQLPRADGEPRGDSALELYTQVLKLDPGNDEAQDGVRRLFEVGKDRIQSDLASGRLDDASRVLALFATAGINTDALRALQANISAARPKWLLQRAEQSISSGNLSVADQLIGQLTASGADPGAVAALRRSLETHKLDQQLQTMAAQVQSAIQSGALLDPPADNARTRLAAMRTLARAHPITLAAQHALQAALLTRVTQATHDGRFDEAQRYLGAAGELGNSAQLGEARHALQSAQATLAARALASARAKAAALQAAAAAPPAAAPSAPTPAPAPRYIPARPVTALHANYPDSTNASGFVIVEFTLELNGSASDAAVVQSDPPGVFDRAAIEAVQRGRYSTTRLHGEPTRARILLRFKPN